MRVLFFLFFLLPIVSFAQQPSQMGQVIDKLNTMQRMAVNREVTNKESLEGVIRQTIEQGKLCNSDAECQNMLLNCFGCTVPVNAKFHQRIYQMVAEYHTYFGKCQTVCPLGAPAPVCQQGQCVLP
jgi:hypothetical protein